MGKQKKKLLSNRETAAFCAQLSLLLKAGISIPEGIAILCEDEKEGKLSLLLQLRESLEDGKSLSAAIEETGHFPEYLIHMMAIGETSGRMEEVLDSLSSYYERNEEVSDTIRSAVTYPLMMIVMMLAVILVVVIKVLPIFESVFRELGGEMSGFARGAMHLGTIISRYSVWIVAVVVLLALLFFILRALPGGQKILSLIFEKCFPKISSAMSVWRFSSAMALMMESGIEMEKSLELTEDLTGSESMKTKIGLLKEEVSQGKMFSEAVVEHQVFSGLYGKMITVGASTGRTDDVMQRIAAEYEEDLERRIERLISVIEPTLVILLSLVVGMILLSVMLPLIGIMSAIG